MMILPHEAAAIQQEVATAFGDSVGVTDRQALDRALGRPYATKNGIPAYPTLLNKLSVLFQSLIENRPFAGANRQTAIVIVAYVLERHGYRLETDRKDLDALLLGVEAGFTSWHRVTLWLKRHTTRIRDNDAS